MHIVSQVFARTRLIGWFFLHLWIVKLWRLDMLFNVHAALSSRLLYCHHFYVYISMVRYAALANATIELCPVWQVVSTGQ
jgi:hypothetical protein